jgi:hypothetical protein
MIILDPAQSTDPCTRGSTFRERSNNRSARGENMTEKLNRPVLRRAALPRRDIVTDRVGPIR